MHENNENQLICSIFLLILINCHQHVPDKKFFFLFVIIACLKINYKVSIKLNETKFINNVI